MSKTEHHRNTPHPQAAIEGATRNKGKSYHSCHRHPSPLCHISSVQFKNFKAFQNFSLPIKHINILVGPNNSGKSTILFSFRILTEAIKKANTRNPILIRGPKGEELGHNISLKDIPSAAENIFFNYNDEEPAIITFRITNGNKLILYFPSQGSCIFIPVSTRITVNTTRDYKREFNVSVSHVPILGPVEHNEPLYEDTAARLALLTPRASRNFRNIWYYDKENFEEFRDLVNSTWPGMDIQKPEIESDTAKVLLRMYCPEDRITREIFWAGFGFQVWCQMLTYIVKGKNSSLLLIDEPDIYLHSDLQRQLLNILKNIGPDIIIATHSTEIISEAEMNEIIIINKNKKSGKRISDPTHYQKVFNVLGSSLNPTLTQIAKTKKVLFVEGNDFQILAQYARILGHMQIANKSFFAVIPAGGFNSVRVKEFKDGIEATLGSRVSVGIVFDRDYRCTEEADQILHELRQLSTFAKIHSCKELENYLLNDQVISRSIQCRIAERNIRLASPITFKGEVKDLIIELVEEVKNDVRAQLLAKQTDYLKKKNTELDYTTINKKVLSEFDKLWDNPETRLRIIPGKEILTNLNKRLQDEYKISLTTQLITSCFKPIDVPQDILEIIEHIKTF